MLYFSTWHNFEHILAEKCYWANFHCCKWSNIEQTISPSGHTDTNTQKRKETKIDFNFKA